MSHSRQGQFVSLHPADIRFTHCTIQSRFRNRKFLHSVFESVLYGRLDIDEIEQLQVVCHQSKYYVIQGNRRLCLFKKLEEAGKIDTIKVKLRPFIQDIFDKKYTTENDGLEVECRDYPTLYMEIDYTTKLWREEQGLPQLSSKSTPSKVQSVRIFNQDEEMKVKYSQNTDYDKIVTNTMSTGYNIGANQLPQGYRPSRSIESQSCHRVMEYNDDPVSTSSSVTNTNYNTRGEQLAQDSLQLERDRSSVWDRSLRAESHNYLSSKRLEETSSSAWGKCNIL